MANAKRIPLPYPEIPYTSLLSIIFTLFNPLIVVVCSATALKY